MECCSKSISWLIEPLFLVLPSHACCEAAPNGADSLRRSAKPPLSRTIESHLQPGIM